MARIAFIRRSARKVLPLAVTSALMMGCAQGPQAIFSRTWGPNPPTLKDAADGMLALVRPSRKDTAEHSGAGSQAALSNSASGADEPGSEGSVRVASMSRTADELLSRGNVFSALARRGGEKGDLSADPFVRTRRASQEQDTRAVPDDDGNVHAEWARTPGDPPVPAAGDPVEPALDDWPVADSRDAYSDPSAYGHHAPGDSQSASEQPYADEFAGDVESQLQRLRAAMQNDLKQPNASPSQPQWPVQSERRRQVDSQLRAVRQLLNDGNLAEAYYAARKAAERADIGGVIYDNDEDSPARVIVELESRLNSAANHPRPKTEFETAGLPDDATYEAVWGNSAAARKAKPSRESTVAQSDSASAESHEWAGDSSNPKGAAAPDDARLESSSVGPQHGALSADVEILRPPSAAGNARDSMIVDANELKPRTMSTPPIRKAEPRQTVSPASDSPRNQSESNRDETRRETSPVRSARIAEPAPRAAAAGVPLTQQMETIRASANQGSVVTVGHEAVLPRIAAAAAVSATSPTPTLVVPSLDGDGDIPASMRASVQAELDAAAHNDSESLAMDGSPIDVAAYGPVVLESESPADAGADTISMRIPAPVMFGLGALAAYLAGLILWRRWKIPAEPTQI